MLNQKHNCSCQHTLILLEEDGSPIPNVRLAPTIRKKEEGYESWPNANDGTLKKKKN